MIVFKSIEWQNFLSTGNAPNKLDLNKSPSTLIVGRNGEGKSTFLDAICFALFNKPFRKINKPQLINSINQKNCVVTVEFDIGTVQYKVVRGMKPNVFEIYNNGQLMNQSAASADYQTILEQQILKLNFKTFTQVVILGAASFVPFMQLPPAHRREVIDDVLDIGLFSTMMQILKEKISKTKDEINSIEAAIQVAKTKVESQKKLISTMMSSKNDQVKSLQDKIDFNLKEIRSNNEKYDEITSQISTMLAECPDSISLKKDIENARKMQAKYKSKVSEIEERLRFFHDHDVCPSCEQSIHEEHKSKIFEGVSAKSNTAIDNLAMVETVLKKLENLKDKWQTINDKVFVLTSDRSTLEDLNDMLKKQNKDLESEIDQLQESVGDIVAEKIKLKEIADEALQLIERKTDLIHEREVQDVGVLLLKDTGVKGAIIKEYLPVMNKLINSYLSAMDFYVHFELDEAFNETIKSRHRDEFTYESFSEGEKMRIDLAILFTWRQIAKMKNSANTNLLILDEIFDSSLDNAGTDYFLTVMNAIAQEKANIFVISHKGDQLVDKFHDVIRFEKKNDFSVMA